LVVILATPEKLVFGGERAELEPAADYLAALRQALARITVGKSGEAAVAADFAIVTSAPPGAR
jgi:hypothetical protein